MKSFAYFLAEDAQKSKEIKTYIATLLSPLGIKVTGGARSGVSYNIRAAVGVDPVEFFSQFKDIKLKPSAESVSGTYDTWEIEVKGVGSSLFVNQTRSAKSGKAFLNTKQLTPDAFNLGGNTLSPSGIKIQVKLAILTMANLNDDVKKFLVDLLDKADEKGNVIDISNITPSEEISSKDLATISKDYGEILAGIWACKNMGFSQVYFPSAINEPLADFYGIRGRIRYPISVKSGGGSSTTIKNLTDVLDQHMKDPTYIESFNETEKNLLNVLFTLRDRSVMEGIVESNKILNTPGIRSLAKIIGVKVDGITLSIIKNWLKSYTDNSHIKKDLLDFHKTMGQGVNDKTWDRLKGDGVIGFVIGPMGHHLTKVLTTQYNTELTKMVRQITLVQLNIDVKKKTITAKREKFKNLKFKFSWGGGAPNPNRNKIGFKVSK